MFCYQCQEALNNTGCTKAGVCGKPADVAELQDLLIYLTKGISFWAVEAATLGIRDQDTDAFVIRSLFSTITNVNFDVERFESLIAEGIRVRDRIHELFQQAYMEKHGSRFEEKIPAAALWRDGDGRAAMLAQARQVSVMSTGDEDLRSLREFLVYGLKGIGAYADHAMVLGFRESPIVDFLHQALAATLDNDIGTEKLLEFILEAGKQAVAVMALLDRANTETYGDPEPTEVYTGTIAGPAILVSGHDLKDLAELLDQTAGTGVNVYTHGEMLPANAYPALKKHRHLIGNFGTSWYNQQAEFPLFTGAILFTTNCLQKPTPGYADRVFTTGLAGWPGLAHIPDRTDSKSKDFSPVIRKALSLGGLAAQEGKRIPIGFARNTLASALEKITGAVKSGTIKRFIVMAGCDGRQKERQYFTDLARALPEDTIILTAGCAKFRYNSLDLGTIDGLPRVIDAGQCNDSYSLAVTALKLAEAFGAETLNQLPISFAIAWYEQKAVTVLLALLHLGVKGIRLGPTLPAFLTEKTAKIVRDAFGLKPISAVHADLQQMLAGG